MAPSLPELTVRAAKAEAEIEELVADLEKMKRGRWESCYTFFSIKFECHPGKNRTLVVTCPRSLSS